MEGRFMSFMRGEPFRRTPNRYEIANTFSNGCYHKNYEDLTIEERKELIRFLSSNSPLFR